MRSPFPIPGRNNIFERIWQSITGFTRAPVQGQQRPLAQSLRNDPSPGVTLLERKYDLEIKEHPVRGAERAKRLIEMVEFCPEIATAVNEISDSVWSSADGDDQGFAIAPTLNDNKTPIDPEIEKPLRRLIDEVIGGSTLEPAAERILNFGDSFLGLGVNTRKMQIEKVLLLPTWECFRIEDNQGQLLGFEQRRSLFDQDPIQMHPLVCVHFRYRRKTLYGRSLFEESWDDWENLKAATEDLANASRAIGINPNLHIMPECATEEYRGDYKRAYEDKRRRGAVTDFYLMKSAEIRKLSQTNPDLKALADTVLFWRSRIVMRSRVPPWLLGLPSMGAREIAGQPALAYSRFINRVRMSVSEGIRQICNLELALNGIDRSRWQYRIVFPKIYTNPYAEQLNPTEADEANAPSIEDLDP